MVYILLADGFEEAEALVPADLLRRAGIETALVSLEGEWAVGGRGMAVRADLTLPQVDLGDVVRREIKIFGTICYTRQEFEECLHFVEDGRVKVEPFITHHFPLKDMEKAYEVYQSKQCIKIILNP